MAFSFFQLIAAKFVAFRIKLLEKQQQDAELAPLVSAFAGQRLNVDKGDVITVDGAPAVLIDDNHVTLNNAGLLSTTGLTSTVLVEAEGALINNLRHGEINAETSGITVEGSATIRNSGEISGDLNGVNFANGGDASGTLINNGTVTSDSRAVNIGGDGVRVVNNGDILGTGDQRNGVIYSDTSADDITIINRSKGTVDAGEGNNGAGIALQTGDDLDARVVNAGEINGRGQADATGGQAGDGIRIFAGTDDARFDGDIVNSGTITSESLQGPVSAIRVANGVGFDGRIENGRDGLIDGANNGVYFGTGDHDATVVNSGTIQSGSRAVNIDGTGVDVINNGDILGTGNQRNGTIYADGTADDYSITNGKRGVIDAGKEYNGAGIALQTGDVEGDSVSGSIRNSGVIEGRGQAAANVGQAGDGIRIFAGAEGVTFDGDIVNNGRISSDSLQGPTAGVRIANGVNFDGDIVNGRRGLIEGENNGLYFGTGDHDADVLNYGTIASGSRAVNIDGSGVDLVNNGGIIGTGDQRNGTIYADATADEYTITNGRRGTVDAGEGNNGSAVALQTGDVAGDTVSASVRNDGLLQGRGDAQEGNGVGDGVRIFSNNEGVTFDGDIVNNGKIFASDDSGAAVAISIEDGVSVTGKIVNNGYLSAQDIAIDASEAGGSVNVVNTGRIDGKVVLSDGDDAFHGAKSRFSTEVDGGAGDDVISTGRSNDFLTGGLGNDTLNGGRGRDTAFYNDADVGVKVDLKAGTATRETGFSVNVENQPLTSLTTDQSAEALVAEAVSGNLYYNVHTTDFPGGEIRGQLELDSDVTHDGIRTLTLRATLDGAQEPDGASDSDATGTGVVTIVVDGHGATYNSELTVSGISQADLLPVAGVSSVHLHNAPAGMNGPVITDIVQDAGGDVNGAAVDAGADTGDGDVFVETFEVDRLISIEDVVGSNDGDVIFGSSSSNTLQGLDGNDVLNGRGGNDILQGGEGSDTFVFEARSGRDKILDFTTEDRLDLSDSGFYFDNFADVQDAARQVGNNTVIDLGRHDQVTLNDFDLGLLTEENVFI